MRESTSLHLRSMFAAAVVFSAGLAGSAAATPMTWTFTGTVSSGPDVGQTVHGFLTLDLASLGPAGTNGVSYANYSQNYLPPYPSPLQVSGTATDGTHTVNVGGGTVSDEAFAEVEKDYCFIGCQDQFYIQGTSTFPSGAHNESYAIDLYTNKGVFGTPSGIFTNKTYVNPDLSVLQPVHWFSAGAGNFGQLLSYNASTGIEDQFVPFTLTSLSVSSVPEPGSLTLLGLGLAGLGFSRRKR